MTLTEYTVYSSNPSTNTDPVVLLPILTSDCTAHNESAVFVSVTIYISAGRLFSGWTNEIVADEAVMAERLTEGSSKSENELKFVLSTRNHFPD